MTLLDFAYPVSEYDPAPGLIVDAGRHRKDILRAVGRPAGRHVSALYNHIVDVGRKVGSAVKLRTVFE
ncbi:hypothetical protein SDC9_105592 [bioreactor metagenome]|uniref:Uncharacterized protein n=1 Tax=bioreactor metagenome TaxID=1076179 RepID=A0A645B046_9ZZZZ